MDERLLIQGQIKIHIGKHGDCDTEQTQPELYR